MSARLRKYSIRSTLARNCSVCIVHLGIMPVEDSLSFQHIDRKLVYDGLHYIISYYFSNIPWLGDQGRFIVGLFFALLDSHRIEHDHWPAYMLEMEDTTEKDFSRFSTIYEQYHISEFIYIHLVSTSSPLHSPRSSLISAPPSI